MSKILEAKQVWFVARNLEAAVRVRISSYARLSEVGVLDLYWVESERQLFREITRWAYDDGASH